MKIWMIRVLWKNKAFDKYLKHANLKKDDDNVDEECCRDMNVKI